jgi:hypothetical protein
MPTNRTAIRRARQPSFTPEVLRLFAELEHMPGQGSQAFKAGSKRLAALLGLSSEWWGGQHVNDRSREPCHPEECQSYHDWYTCRRVRQALLAAIGP